ncbi:MAG TPA: DNA repair protein RecN [Polyangia bacterium]|nr:DNA repair protein RecN [Polyangia bacterium]
MLTLLRISGFALIDELEIAFGPGLTAVTGETGAGKSILVEALGLLRGGRAGADLIRTGRDEARVEAILELPAQSELWARLADDGRRADVDDDEGLVVRRVIARGGRGRAHLGGSLATAADLTATVAGLIDIASQHDQQSLTDPESQLAILDAFAENAALRAEMIAAHAARSESTSTLATFSANALALSEREDLLRFQLTELEAARPTPGEDEALTAERERLKGAERFFAATASGEETLYAGDGAVAERVAGVLRDLTPLAALDPTLAPLVERLGDAQAMIEDAARELGRYARGIRSDPARLVEIEERLFLLQRLCRKHGGTVADLAARQAALGAELGEIGSYEEGLAARQAEATAAEARAATAAAALSTSRRQAAGNLERKVSAVLRELGFASARLPVVVETRELGPSGADRVRFLFAPNPGEEPRPLAKIASGGELSRVMLAVKQTLARTDRVLTYVFDEVDAGIGGGTAEVIGRKLKRLAANRQVIVITHLPQVAAFADAHVRVTKTTTRGKTRVEIVRLPDSERPGEIARMLAGAAPSAQAAAHAEEMLRNARQPSG